MFKQRILVQLSVKGDVRFISHHDLMRLLGRAARRAGLPVAMSEGFNPRQKIAFLLARGVGVASEKEYAEIDLADWVSVGEVARRLNEKLPEGVRVEGAWLGNPHEIHRVVGISYRVDCRREPGWTREGAGDLLNRREVWVERPRKKPGHGDLRKVNIRPFIRGVSVGERAVEFSLEVSDSGTARPEELVQALGVSEETLLSECSVTRTDMKLSPPI
jgi:radical SAM-linked protein